MIKPIAMIVISLSLMSGCASVPMESSDKSAHAKQFNPPSDGKAGLYVYRAGSFGGALKKDIWINGECLGQSAPNVFFYEEVNGGDEVKISTESEFSPNDLVVKTEDGKNYFVKQYIKMGMFVGGAGVEVIEENKAKEAISKLNLAVKGKCSS
ncbi:DUF2846 domain-containing protein [Shewanella sp. AS1]|uniref:DUF2846 domain-containing protein n=1 Tax=Shewanella sp. AS1 TaxID=2907626 RepID=UPI001F341030|nr:DUF2846 domain-containing protein [Shewanella sp. AS1]MCE9677810.1 DUF2846 domain-containing protein [Shewanella sp. AS1]